MEIAALITRQNKEFYFIFKKKKGFCLTCKLTANSEEEGRHGRKEKTQNCISESAFFFFFFNKQAHKIHIFSF